MNQEWVDLFDGETLEGWSATIGDGNWSVEDGTIRCHGETGGMLYSHGTYEDFDLDLEFKIAEGVNSGVFFRWSDLEDPVHTGLEVQILDDETIDAPPHKSCGALYDLVAPSNDAMRSAGEWNRLELTCDGSMIQESLNGERIVEADIDRWIRPGENPDGTDNKFRYAWANMPRRGHIGLQDHDGDVWFRNIRIRER